MAIGPYVYYQSKHKLQLSKSHITIAPSQYQVTKNPANGKKEHVFVDLQAVYPSPEEPGTELSFEEIWAANRGWLDQSSDRVSTGDYPDESGPPVVASGKLAVHPDLITVDENGRIPEPHHDGRGRKKKVMEVNETQISKSPSQTQAILSNTQ